MTSTLLLRNPTRVIDIRVIVVPIGFGEYTAMGLLVTPLQRKNVSSNFERDSEPLGRGVLNAVA